MFKKIQEAVLVREPFLMIIDMFFIYFFKFYLSKDRTKYRLTHKGIIKSECLHIANRVIFGELKLFIPFLCPSSLKSQIYCTIIDVM